MPAADAFRSSLLELHVYFETAVLYFRIYFGDHHFIGFPVEIKIGFQAGENAVDIMFINLCTHFESIKVIDLSDVLPRLNAGTHFHVDGRQLPVYRGAYHQVGQVILHEGEVTLRARYGAFELGDLGFRILQLVFLRLYLYLALAAQALILPFGFKVLLFCHHFVFEQFMVPLEDILRLIYLVIQVAEGFLQGEAVLFQPEPGVLQLIDKAVHLGFTVHEIHHEALVFKPENGVARFHHTTAFHEFAGYIPALNGIEPDGFQGMHHSGYGDVLIEGAFGDLGNGDLIFFHVKLATLVRENKAPEEQKHYRTTASVNEEALLGPIFLFELSVHDYNCWRYKVNPCAKPCQTAKPASMADVASPTRAWPVPKRTGGVRFRTAAPSGKRP